VISLIKLSHLQKYFFKGKPNAIHVLNDVSLELENSGMVVILGKSGSGKTTLLNVIGGLDGASGEIAYDELKFSRYKMDDIDHFRNEHIGYIFQNYLLLNDSTVSENIGLALRMAGFSDNDEILRRTNAALEAVGMLKYKRRMASALSGGQQQRVAIARALAKDASIIIADEPTGNLDSENSFDIMVILKKLSRTRLVLLVTHNETLARDFGDRIIGFADGKIVSDEKLTGGSLSEKSQSSLNQLQANKVYLGDMKQEQTDTNGVRVSTFADTDEKLSLDLKVVSIKGKAYLLFDDKRFVVNPPLQFLEGTTPTHEDKEAMANESKFDTSGFHPKEKEKINVWEILKHAFLRFFRPQKTRSHVFNIAMAILGATMATVTVVVYSTVTNYSTDAYFQAYDQNGVYVDDSGTLGESISAVDFAGIMEDPDSGVTGALFNHYANNVLKNFSMLRIPYNFDGTAYYYDISNKNYAQIYGYPSLFNIDSEDLVLGNLPQNEGECTLDQSFIDEVRKVYSLREVTDEDILGSTIRFGSLRGQSATILTVVGLTDTGSFRVTLDEKSGPRMVSRIMMESSGSNVSESFLESRMKRYTFEEKTPAGIIPVGATSLTVPNVWASSAYYELASRMIPSDEVNVIGYYPEDNLEWVLATQDDVDRYLSDNPIITGSSPLGGLAELEGLTLTNGRLPTAFKEIVISDYSYENGAHALSGYTVVGSVETDFEHRDSWYATLPTVEYRLMEMTSRTAVPLSPEHTLDDVLVPSDLFLSKDVAKTVDYFEALGHRAIRYGTYVNAEFLQATIAQNRPFVITFGILFVIVILLFYLTTRSKMIKNIYPIGVYRSLGAKRGKIMRLFLSDNIIQATFTNVAAFLVVSVLLTRLLLNLGMGGMPIWVYLLGIVLSYAVPFFATWLPLAQLLSKTPNQITVKYDI